MKKEDIQDTLDELVKEYAKSQSIEMYLGVPISEFTKEELLAVLSELYKENQQQFDSHQRSIRLMGDLCRAVH